MPTMNLTTKSARQVWASPDGQRKIYEIMMDYEGKPVKAKTYSDAIATVGWSGQAETYEKTGRNGVETFVKQPPKEGGSYSGSSGSQGGYKGGAGKFQADPFTMYLSYAKDIIVAMIMSDKLVAKTTYSDLIDQTLIGAYTLYQGRPDAIDIVKEITTVSPDVVHEDVGGPVDLSLVDKVFNGETESEEELPWAGIKGEDG